MYNGDQIQPVGAGIFFLALSVRFARLAARFTHGYSNSAPSEQMT